MASTDEPIGLTARIRIMLVTNHRMLGHDQFHRPGPHSFPDETHLTCETGWCGQLNELRALAEARSDAVLREATDAALRAGRTYSYPADQAEKVTLDAKVWDALVDAAVFHKCAPAAASPGAVPERQDWDVMATAVWNVVTKIGVPGLMIDLRAEYDRLRGGGE